MNTNNKHLSLEQRNIVEQGLNQNWSLTKIANEIGKDDRTISKEIRKHMIKKQGNSYDGRNICKHISSCTVKKLCNIPCKKMCKTCSLCNSKCPSFEPFTCKRNIRFPYVCNGCSKKTTCRKTKYYYRALIAFKDYKTSLSESRQGISLTKLELSNLDALVSPQVLNGKSIASVHRLLNVDCSLSSLYNYVEKGYLSVRNIDLARKVSFRPRKKRQTPKDTKARKGRVLEDLNLYLAEHPEAQVVEMDTVEGIKGGKVLLTLFLRNCKLMLAFLLDEKTTEAVKEVFDNLEKIFTYDVFCKVFEVILTDNGTEFSDPLSLEFNDEGIGRSRIFYCNPSAAYQKGGIEKNHEFIRYFIPKGTSMDNLTQKQIDEMMNNINNYNRESLNWNSPYSLAKILLGEEVLKKLNFSYIPFEEVKLTKLLQKIK